MTRGTIITVIVVGFASLFILTARHTAGWVSGEEVAAGLIYYPTFIASAVIILIALASLAQRQSVGAAFLCMLLCSALPFQYALEQYRLSKHRKWANWAAMAYRLTPLLVQYDATHPDATRYLSGGSEEVSIDGFDQFALGSDFTLATVMVEGQRRLATPWGEPVCYVKSRGDDETIVFRGMKAIITFGGGGDEKAWENPNGLGFARPASPDSIENRSDNEPIHVLMSYRFSRRHIEDMEIMRRREAEAKNK